MVRRKGYPHWPGLAEFLADRQTAAMVWLPVAFRVKKGKDGGPDEYIEDTKPQRDDALRRGFSATVVRWDEGIRTVGCQLFFRLPTKAQDALKSAIEHVVGVMEWQDSLPATIRAVTHMP